MALADAGIDSPEVDARATRGARRGHAPVASLVVLDELGDEFFCRYDELVAARAKRVPLQHLIGSAAFGPVTVRRRPGRVHSAAGDRIPAGMGHGTTLPARPLIVDLCTGSGALALALSLHWPDARVIAVDDSDDALDYARRNVAGTPVELLRADVTQTGLLPELDGRVDLDRRQPALYSRRCGSWNPKWPNMIRRTPCSAARTG